METKLGSGSGSISTEFRVAPLRDLCLADGGIQTGPFGSQLHQKDYTTHGTPIITVEHIGDNRIIHKDLPLVSEGDRVRLSRYTMRKGDIIFSRVGSVDRRALVREGENGWLFSGRCLRVRVDEQKISPEYLSWFFGLESFKEYIRRVAVGATMPSLNTKILQEIPVCLPSLSEQKRIAGILGALDDKIELNRKMNETLEQMARALFKSWFVDFDPVHAKATGRQPAGMDKATADLFPSCFVDSELGKIPRGWRAASIYEISDVIYGAPFASGLFNTASAGRPLVRIRDLASEEPAVFTTEVHPKGYLLKPGDIAVGMDGEFRAYLWAGQESWLNQRVCVFAPKPGFSNAFVRNSIIKPLAEVEATETATTVIHLGKNDIDRFKVVVPEGSVSVAFAETCQAWYNQIVSNRKQSRSLAKLRDTLIPRLLSGSN
jgi:type I restriction enzyme S subunit